MDALTISAASGMRARLESLEMLANNLANAATGGYKGDREFYSLYLSPEAAAAAANGAGGAPSTLPVIERHWTDFSQGTLRPTGNMLDFALSGSGFFAVNGPSGPLYTRNGNFRLSVAGELVTKEGYAVRFVGGESEQLEPGSRLEVDSDGTLHQNGQTLGQLEVVGFADPSVLAKQESSYFRIADLNATPVAATDTQVGQGRLEDSNVASAEAAVRLVGIMRQFEMLQKAISLGADMNRKAVEEVARVGS